MLLLLDIMVDLKLKKNLEAVSATNPIICAIAKKMMQKQSEELKKLNP